MEGNGGDPARNSHIAAARDDPESVRGGERSEPAGNSHPAATRDNMESGNGGETLQARASRNFPTAIAGDDEEISDGGDIKKPAHNSNTPIARDDLEVGNGGGNLAPARKPHISVARDDPEMGNVGEIKEDGKEMKTREIGDLEEEEKKGKKKKKKKKKTKEEKESEKLPTVPFFRLFSFATRFDYLLMGIGFIGAAIHGASLPVLFLFFGKLLNGLGGSRFGGEVAHEVNKYALYFVYLGLVNLGSSWVEVSCWMHSGERQASRMREEYLKALLRQEIAYFDTDSSTGDFVNTISGDPLMVQDAISEKVGNFVHYICTFIAGFSVGFSSQWKIALITVAVVPLIATAGGYYVYNMTSITARSAASYARAGEFAEQATSQVRTVYSFVGEERFVKSYGEALASSTAISSKGGYAKGFGMGAVFGVLFMCWATLLWVGGVLVRSGETDGGTALATIFAVIIGSMSLGQAAPNLGAFARGKAAAYKIFEMIKREPQMNRDAGGDKLDSVEGHLKLQNVHFAYPSRPDVPIFKDFSLEISKGQTVAIVGNSGSGKSTIVSLIERFYDPNAGAVLLDGHDIRTLDLTWLRGQIGLVNQEPALFATTIRTNILYGKEDADKEEISEAARAANAKTFIEQLPLGYETQVGEKGVQLSGGQKQRVAIARAMLKNPKILLLDEATSALDAASESVVQEALDRLMVGRTTVVVAHRLSTIRNADAIAVVQEGHIVEMGTHDELISKPDGAYSALIRLQEMAADAGGVVGPKRTSDLGGNSLSKSFGSVSQPGSQRFGSVSQRQPSMDRISQSLSLTRHGQSKRSTVSSENIETLPPPEKTKEETQVEKGPFMRLLRLSKADWKYVVSGTIGSMFAGAFNPTYALMIASSLAAFYNPDKAYMKRHIREYSLVLVGLGIAAPIVYTWQHSSLGIAGERLVERVRLLMFASVLQNELAWFDRDENNSAQIAARLNSDATNVRAVIGDRVAIIVQNTALMSYAFTVGFILQWKLTLVMLACFPVLIACAYVDKLFLTGFSGDQSGAHARATRVAAEAVANIRTVAAFNAENKIQELFASELEGPARRSLARGQSAGIGYGIAQCVLYCTYALGLWYAGKLVSTGEAGASRVIKVFFVVVVSSFGASETLASTPDLVKGSQAARSVFAVVDRATRIEPDDPEGDKPDTIRGAIQFKDVTFAYPSRPDVIIFKDLNLKVRTGRSLALVGASGSGKSSVIALIERFYDPISGHVLIDGVDLRRYNLRAIRNHIGLVQQEPALFGTTIMQNILYGKEGATEAEVIEAAKAANAHNFVSALPEGYNTEVGDRGIQLSGGQKQRIAIARAVLKDPAILLLDEATSALDAESERVVQEALDKLMEGRTSVMVAHRLSTIRNADSIAVVQDGNILEEGSHAELVNENGAYSRLINLQNRVQESQNAPTPPPPRISSVER